MAGFNSKVVVCQPHRDHLLPILSMNRKDCIRYSWEVFRMDRRSIKNGWSPVSAAAWIRGKNLMQCLPALPTRSSGLSSAIQQKTELPMIRVASLRTVRQVPIRESWRSFYIAGLRFSEKIREKDLRTVLEFYYAHRDENVKDLVHAVCTNTAFWGEDLTEITGFETAVCNYLKQICEKGTYAVMEALVK